MSAGYTQIARLAFPLVAAVLAAVVALHAIEPAPRCPDCAPAAAPSPTPALRDTFDSIYRDQTWGAGSGGVGTSGAGSTLAATALYRAFLQQFLADNHIRSVVDAGCGDWEFSHTVDWTGIDYKGYDIVDAVVAADTAKYGGSNVHFFAANIVEAELPAADLLIVKDVLQHLPNADVARFLTQVTGARKYRHALIVNGVTPGALTARNVDIAIADVQRGGYRNLDITRPPFDVRGDKPLTWWANGSMHQVVHVTTDPSWHPDGARP